MADKMKSILGAVQSPNLPLKAGDQYLIVKVLDVPGLVNQQSKAGGFLAKLAQSFELPTMESVVYDRMRDEMAKGFLQKGVSPDLVDVRVVAVPLPTGERPKAHLLAGAVVGAVGMSALWSLGSWLLARRK